MPRRQTSLPPATEAQTHVVRSGRNRYHLIPYIGNKSGFAHIFDELVPADAGGGRIIDVFGGGGAFSIYSCYRFGSDRVTYNDKNPVLTNFMRHVRDDPDGLIREYGRHRELSSPGHFKEMRDSALDDGLGGAGRFLYLAKNAFSGKIRFNGSGRFNAPMRKGSRCPTAREDDIRRISGVVRRMEITTSSFESFADAEGAFLYLDPPYMNNTNNHYSGVPSTEDFAGFVNRVSPHNHVMISEQNDLDKIGIAGPYRTYRILLNRSLQYNTREDSREIIAINYDPCAAQRI